MIHYYYFFEPDSETVIPDNQLDNLIQKQWYPITSWITGKPIIAHRLTFLLWFTLRNTFQVLLLNRKSIWGMGAKSPVEGVGSFAPHMGGLGGWSSPNTKINFEHFFFARKICCFDFDDFFLHTLQIIL